MASDSPLPLGGSEAVSLAFAPKKTDPLTDEAEFLARWELETGLPLRCHVKVARGAHKGRTGIVMHFGQRPGLVLVGLDATATEKQRLARMPRVFVRYVAAPDPPPPSAFNAAGELELGHLWKAAAQKIRDEGVTTLGTLGSPNRRG